MSKRKVDKRAIMIYVLSKELFEFNEAVEDYVWEFHGADWENDMDWHSRVLDIIHNTIDEIAGEMYVEGKKFKKSCVKEYVKIMTRSIIALGPPKTSLDVDSSSTIDDKLNRKENKDGL